jgi:hypothetical protein
MLGLIRRDLSAVSQHHLRGKQIVGGESVFAAQRSVTARERQPSNPNGLHLAGDRRQPVRAGRSDDVTRSRSALHNSRAAA